MLNDSKFKLVNIEYHILLLIVDIACLFYLALKSSPNLVVRLCQKTTYYRLFLESISFMAASLESPCYKPRPDCSEKGDGR